MSIASEISRLNIAKADIKAEIQNKGVSVPSSTKIDGYPSLINQIQTFDPYNGHAYVEIGGLKWATMNVGANSVTEYGQYFQWGDTAGYTASQVGSSGTTYAKPFDWADYKFGNGTSSPGATGQTKYNASDTKTALDFCDDAARVNWGGSWRMPTTAEFQALGNAVTTAWTTDYQGSGAAGLVCTDKTDSSKVLFFPAAGECEKGSVTSRIGSYWSSSLYTVFVGDRYASACGFGRSSVDWDGYGMRYIGYSVRPVIGVSVHDYVEIGGLKWATMNVGANSVTDTGLYFQWGDTQGYTADQVGSGSGKKYFDWADYKYYNGASPFNVSGLTKYNSTDGKTVLEASDDAVRANWFGWRSPTTEEFIALGNAVNTAWTEDYQGSGVAGIICTDKTDSSKVLFFPVAGTCYNGSVSGVGSYGKYWSSSVMSSNNANYAYPMNLSDSGVNWEYFGSRCEGYSVRLVI